MIRCYKALCERYLWSCETIKIIHAYYSLAYMFSVEQYVYVGVDAARENEFVAFFLRSFLSLLFRLGCCSSSTRLLFLFSSIAFRRVWTFFPCFARAFCAVFLNCIFISQPKSHMASTGRKKSCFRIFINCCRFYFHRAAAPFLASLLWLVLVLVLVANKQFSYSPTYIGHISHYRK